jgi:hypothetical protein
VLVECAEENIKPKENEQKIFESCFDTGKKKKHRRRETDLTTTISSCHIFNVSYEASLLSKA